MRHVSRRTKAEEVFPCGERFALCETAGWPDGEIIYANQGSYHAAGSLGPWGDLQPMVQGSAFVRLKMAETDPSNLRWIHQALDSLSHLRKHGLVSGMKQQRFVIPDEEVIELQIECRRKNGDAEYLGGDLI